MSALATLQDPQTGPARAATRQERRRCRRVARGCGARDAVSGCTCPRRLRSRCSFASSRSRCLTQAWVRFRHTGHRMTRRSCRVRTRGSTRRPAARIEGSAAPTGIERSDLDRWADEGGSVVVCTGPRPAGRRNLTCRVTALVMYRPRRGVPVTTMIAVAPASADAGAMAAVAPAAGRRCSRRSNEGASRSYVSRSVCE